MAISPALKIPRGTNLLGQLPQPSTPLMRSIDIGDRGATVVDRNGSIIDLDSHLEEPTPLNGPPCDVTSVALFDLEKWTACRDGSIWQLSDDEWHSMGRVPGATHLTADQDVWAWGNEGLWKNDRGRWRRQFAGTVVAAAARGTWVAWSDGTSVMVSRGDEISTVAGTLEEVRSLAWQGPALVAVDSNGIRRSGGAILPWRQVHPGIESIAAIAGNRDQLWLVREDGLVLESSLEQCASLWVPEERRSGDVLREPRGLAATPRGWFVTADSLNHRVVWYSEQGVCIDHMGSEGTIPGAFREPSGLALSGDGTLAITDTWNGRVQLLRPDGSLQIVGAGLFGPRAAVWTANGSLLVSDTGNSRILRFSPPNWDQELVATLPAPVVGLASAAGLLAAAVPSDGAIVLIDPSNGEMVRRIEIPGWDNRQQQEGYLTVLPSGDLVASAPDPGELWIADPTGSNPPRLLRTGLPGVTGLTLLPDGQVLAALTWEHRLVKVDTTYGPEGSTTP